MAASADRAVAIVAAVRTPSGAFLGGLSEMSATQLGSVVIKAALERAGVAPETVEEVFMGNVLSAGLGQAPASQASFGAGIPSANCTTVNKVCASGLKAVDFGAQSIALGRADVVVAGGMESMSGAPHLLKKSRVGTRYGNTELIDGCQFDGLRDPYADQPMGMAGELCAARHSFGRDEQDAYAAGTFERAIAAQAAGLFAAELVPVTVAGRTGAVTVSADEGLAKYIPGKLASLKPAFKADGVITAGNASPLSDGASAVLLMSAVKAASMGVAPLAWIVGAADASQAPMEFTTSPALAIPRALTQAGLAVADIALWEINEAFAVVAMANTRLLGLPAERVNVHGGALALGHALGSSGCRITVTLVHALRRLRESKGEGPVFGVAAVCNGGGGATAVVIRVD